MPYRRLVDTRLVVNSGRVGMPYGRPGDSRALLHGAQVHLRHTAFDLDDAVRRVVEESGYGDGQAWAEHSGGTTDAGALRAFGPRDGRAVS
ncbi:hypothetical protein H1R13_19500 [Streptomyces mexicanus]|uniref:Uncharacterized protein n=1 Tax=Streptomyces mexicanus TaxID=178566 RepID=A0A7X1I5R1_9ACTN|nr:hypothetical protein [Streptomyces mexicanus]